MRVFLPATFDLLEQLDQGQMPIRSGYGFCVTPQLVEAFAGEENTDEDEIDYFAFLDAAQASLRLLAIGSNNRPHARVVVSADIPDAHCTLQPDLGDTVVALDPAVVELSQVVAIHVDIEASESQTAAAIEVIDAADLGDLDAQHVVAEAQDNFMAWYGSSELKIVLGQEEEPSLGDFAG